MLPESPREGLGARIARPREGKYRSSLPFCDLRHDVSRGAKAVESERLAVACDHQRTPANQPGAEQRCERHIAAGLAKRECIARIGDRRRGEATVPRVTSEERLIAQIFLTARAIRADAAGVTEPGDSHTLPERHPFDAGPDCLDPADDLVARDDRQFWVRKLAIDNMQIRAADAARGHLHADLARPGLPIGEIRPFKGAPKLF